MAPPRMWYRPLISAGLLDRGSVLRLLDDTQIVVVSRDASRQMRHRSPSATLPHSRQNAMRSFACTIACGQALRVLGGRLHQPEREPLRGLRAHAGQPRQLVDQLLDRALVRHWLVPAFGRRVGRPARRASPARAGAPLPRSADSSSSTISAPRATGRVPRLAHHAHDARPDAEQLAERRAQVLRSWPRPSGPRTSSSGGNASSSVSPS